MAAVMRWAISKTPKTCKKCGKTIHPGDPYLNIPKNYRGMSGNYCEKCDHERLYWAGHLVEQEHKGRHPKPTKARVKHAENFFRTHGGN
jgi:hypothetical protein